MENWEEKIIANNRSREAAIISPQATASSKADRLIPEETGDDINIRPAFFHDTDRIIHSRAYARYIDKTQVFFLFNNDHITHRVLHVQLVSKIARTLGRFLRLNEDLIEAIALGHDIGHPPFGHDGERYLNDICRENGLGCFKHNAQSVRFLLELENQGRGLNLTLQTLDGILCHNGEFISDRYEPARPQTWEAFLDDYRRCWEEQEFGRDLKPSTMEGCVVRVADVIAYIGRDIEDAITVRLMTREEIPEPIAAVLGRSNREIVDSLIRDLTANSLGQDFLSFSPPVLEAFLALREFNYSRIYHNTRKRTEDKKIKGMFQALYSTFLSDLEEDNRKSALFFDYLEEMPPEYRRNTSPGRVVVDFLAGMTDDYFRDQFRERFWPRSFGRYMGNT